MLLGFDWTLSIDLLTKKFRKKDNAKLSTCYPLSGRAVTVFIIIDVYILHNSVNNVNYCCIFYLSFFCVGIS